MRQYNTLCDLCGLVIPGLPSYKPNFRPVGDNVIKLIIYSSEMKAEWELCGSCYDNIRNASPDTQELFFNRIPSVEKQQERFTMKYFHLLLMKGHNLKTYIRGDKKEKV